MSLAVPLRLVVLFRLPQYRAPKPCRNPVGAIDPCVMSRHLRRDIGLEDFPCIPRSTDLRQTP